MPRRFPRLRFEQLETRRMLSADVATAAEPVDSAPAPVIAPAIVAPAAPAASDIVEEEPVLSDFLPPISVQATDVALTQLFDDPGLPASEVPAVATFDLPDTEESSELEPFEFELVDGVETPSLDVDPEPVAEEDVPQELSREDRQEAVAAEEEAEQPV